MRMIYAAAGIPAVLVLSAAVALAFGNTLPQVSPPVLVAGTDVGRARLALMSMVPVGTPEDVAFSKLRNQGLDCAVSMPPLANLTWRVIECSSKSSASRSVLAVDVAGRNGVVADIGVEDIACASRADITDPDPEPGGCNLSGKRLLAVEAQSRAAESALVAEALGKP